MYELDILDFLGFVDFGEMGDISKFLICKPSAFLDIFSRRRNAHSHYLYCVMYYEKLNLDLERAREEVDEAEKEYLDFINLNIVPRWRIL